MDSHSTDELLNDLERELRRLETDRRGAEAKRDQALTVVESGEDTGFSLNLALNDLRKIEHRIEQLRNLITKRREDLSS